MSKKSHGGAWKVAYADFVTSMMALFLVLWILAMSEEMKKGIADYFRAKALLMRNFSDASKTPKMAVNTSKLKQSDVQEAADNLQSIFRRNNNSLTDTDEFRFEFLNDGFRIQALDRSNRPLFEGGGSKLTDYGRWVLSVIAWEIERFPLKVEVEGHTQGGDSSLEHSEDVWELSTHRAVAAQRCLEENGVRPSQFFRVAGYADRQPLESEQANAELNRRITVTLRLDPNADAESLQKMFPKP